ARSQRRAGGIGVPGGGARTLRSGAQGRFDARRDCNKTAARPAKITAEGISTTFDRAVLGMRKTSMRSTTHPLSSPRRRGPIRRVLAMRHCKRDFESPVVMGPRLRGDDAEDVARAVVLLI